MISKPFPIQIFLTVFLVLGSSSFLLGQTEAEEALLEGQDDKAASELLECLQVLRSHPMDLNRATLQDLQSLPILSPVQARFIIRERTKNGFYNLWTDLMKRLNFGEDLLQLLRPYFIVIDRKSKMKELFRLRWRHEKRLQKASGYENGVYTGSPWKGYQRMDFVLGRNLQGGLLVEKDPGERQWNDHLVGYIETSRVPGTTRFLVGNFRMEIGQGLVFWGPYGLSKGPDPVAPVKKRAREAKGYTYSDENSYLTGGVVETRIHSASITFFTSHTLLDATLNPDGSVNGFFSSGLHRIESEVKKRDVLREALYGGRITKEWSWGNVGVTGWSGCYSKEIRRSHLAQYRFDFQGNRNHVVGLDYDFFFGRLNIFGEFAQSRSRGWAITGNTIADLDKVSLVVSYRRYDPDFQNPHGLGFGYGLPQNQEGFYFGLSGKIGSGTQISLFYDLFRKPWRTYSIPVPTRGDDLFVQFDKKFSSALDIHFRVRLRRGEVLKTGMTLSKREKDFLEDRIHGLYRFELRFRPSSRLRLKSRVEISRVFYPEVWGEVYSLSHKETGFLLFEDFWYRPFRKLTMSARWITFDTGSYDSRIYEFENDLPGVLTIKPLYGKGFRWYLLLRCRIFRILQITAKFSTTYHDGVHFWGSGHDRINGDIDREFGIQVDLRI